MSILLAVWGTIAAFVGILLFTIGRSAVHEIEAGLAFLIATVAIGCAGIIEAVKRSGKTEKEPTQAPVQDW